MNTAAAHKRSPPRRDHEPYKSSPRTLILLRPILILSSLWHFKTYWFLLRIISLPPNSQAGILSAVRDKLEIFTKHDPFAVGRDMHANRRKDTYTDVITQPVSFR
jgi:hypothetical protein